MVRPMMTFYFQIAVAAVLVATAVYDMKSGRIPNWVALVLVAIFGAFAFATMTLTGVMWQLIFAAGVFGFGLVLYVITGAGAGAIKLMAAAALFMPIDRGAALFGILILAMFALGVIVTIINRTLRSENSNWAFLKSPIMPLSLPVGATALLGMFWL